VRRKSLVVLTLGVLLVVGAVAYALINPNFTPVNLVEKADMILLLKISPADDKGKALAEVVRTLKPKDKGPKAAQVIDLTKSANVEHAKAVRQMIAALGDGPALLFVGKGEKDEPVSKLHLGGKWVSLDKAQAENTWEVDVIDSHMEATWAGGTDMLLKMTDLLLQYPDTDVPVAASGGWEEAVIPGKVEGKVCQALAVDLAGRGELALYVASEGGDKIFACNAKTKKYEELTARLKLGSKSVTAAWGDFNGDGRLDLASWDGKALTIWSLSADGTLASAPVADAPKDDCLGLAALEVGVKGRAGILWSGKAGPVVLVPDKDKAGVFAAKPLAIAAGALKDPGGPGACLVADFDGDGVADVLQPFAKGSVFFKGKGGGAFAEGAACDVALGEGRTAAFLGDYDGDGRIDVFTVAEDSPRLWQNEGKGKFANLFAICGELTYISKPGCIGGNTCDFNNDGRQDAFLTYPDMGAQVFFNRAFRSFGHAHKPIDLAETNNLPDALKGQLAGVLADFNGDGAQDMALVVKDDCAGLATLDAGVKGRAGLLWNSKAAPVLFVPDKDKAGAFAQKRLTIGPGALKDPTGPGACLLADFDGDGVADVLQPFAKGSVLYKGKGGGEFAEGAACEVAPGEGKARELAAISLAGKGPMALFSASFEGGDRVFACNAQTGKFEELAVRLKLGSKSVAAAWGDFNGDGRLDLASWDGKALTVWSLSAAGSFASAPIAGAPKDDCVGLAGLDVGIKGRAGILWSGKTAPVVLVPDKDKAGVFAAKPLAVGEKILEALKDFSGPGACLVADFDGDGVTDLLQPFAKGSVFYKGKGGGEFAEGAACDVVPGEGKVRDLAAMNLAGKGPMVLFLASESGDKVFAYSAEAKKFEELSAKLKLASRSAPAAWADLNGDGRPDLASWDGKALTVWLQAADGSFASAAVAEGPFDSTVYVLPQTVAGDAALAVRVALAPGGTTAGPVTVTAVNDRRALGAWIVSPGTAEAFFGRSDAGDVTVTWTLPGGEPQKKTFTLENKPIRFVIPTGAPESVAGLPEAGKPSGPAATPSAIPRPGQGPPASEGGSTTRIIILVLVGLAVVVVVAVAIAKSRKPPAGTA